MNEPIFQILASTLSVRKSHSKERNIEIVAHNECYFCIFTEKSVQTKS